jgi:DNA primase
MSTDTQAIKQQFDLIAYAGQYSQLRKIATTNGGEYAGPCPRCGGTDRFHVQGSGLFMCRQCHPEWSDAIEFIRWMDGRSFQEAVMTMGGEGEPVRRPTAAPAPIEPDTDRSVWTAAGVDLMAEAYQELLSDQGDRAREYLQSRGITTRSIERWQLGYIPADRWDPPEKWGMTGKKVYIPRGILIPCWDAAGLHYLKIRRAENDPKYINIRGGHGWPFGLQTIIEKSTIEAILFEGEFDVMLARDTGYSGVGYFSMPASQAIPAAAVPWLQSLQAVIVQMDNDQAGQQAAVKWAQIPGFRKAELFPTGNDLSEYYQAGGDVLEWLMRQVLLAVGGDK